MRNVIILILLVLVSAGQALAQNDGECLTFTEALLENGDLVAANIPTFSDDSEVLLEKFLALQAARHFLIDAQRAPILCHEEPALNLLDTAIHYQDYVTLRLGQKLVKDDPSIAPMLESTLEAADSHYDAYDAFWNPPDA